MSAQGRDNSNRQRHAHGRIAGGGGGPGGPDPPPPPLAHYVGFVTLDPKLDPLLDPLFSLALCRPKMDPLFKNPGSAPDAPGRV